ncbi:MEKHLA domain-containing protein [Synechococcus sp. PCC 6312]|uniref:MEKHLA domain-containing protein n=1 Tax=Synechococcus sp. (strain ATCC 27167 / PCC 6312) TaxID=195253 RepID=UPI00029F466D|nr:MEKHLA domain-containing protein [Synechococcus sp. PCC 6312]AFY60824.1 MEKHLA domain-containing protein [Synechococcus sp. PCC 6312]
MNISPWQTPAYQQHAQFLWQSFHHWTSRWLIPNLSNSWETLSPIERTTALFEYPNPILSHDGQPDPIFNYGNQASLKLWELAWDELIQMPSRLSAETPAQSERATLLQRAAQQGVIEHYRGIRMSRTGKRFEIRNATIWTVQNDQNQTIGQAATFDQWDYLGEK